MPSAGTVPPYLAHRYKPYDEGLHRQTKRISTSVSDIRLLTPSRLSSLCPTLIPKCSCSYRRGKSLVRTSLDFGAPRDRHVSVFETTIRIFAGLLSADWLEREYFKLEPVRFIAERSKTSACYSTWFLTWRGGCPWHSILLAGYHSA